MNSQIKADIELFGKGIADITVRLDAYIVNLEGELEKLTKERDDAKNQALENERKGRRALERLTNELRGAYGPKLGKLYDALLVPPDFGGLYVSVPECPELNHRAELVDGKLTWGWKLQQGEATIALELTRAGLDGLLRWERNEGVKILAGEDAIMRLWVLQDEKQLQALLRGSATP